MNQLLTYEEKYQEGRVQMREMLQQAAQYERQADELLQNLNLQVDLSDQVATEDPNQHLYPSSGGFGFGATQNQVGLFTKHKNCKFYNIYARSVF